jgi:hypothetical protein
MKQTNTNLEQTKITPHFQHIRLEEMQTKDPDRQLNHPWRLDWVF